MRHDDMAAASREVLALLRSPVSVSSAQDVAAEREQFLPRLVSMIRALPQQRAAHRAGRRRRFWAATAAAAALVLVMGGAALNGRSDEVAPEASDTAAPRGATLMAGSLRTEQGRPLTGGERFAEDAPLTTPADQSALVLTEAGVQVTFAPATRASIPAPQQRQRMNLSRGQVTLDVPPLPRGTSLSVVTPEATVVVHGTRFSVAHDVNTQATCVRVTEGRVAVTRRGSGWQVVVAGQSSGCGEAEATPAKALRSSSAAAASPDVRVAAKARVAQRRRSQARRNRVTAPAPATEPPAGPAAGSQPPSTLAQQNRLLTQALAAEQSGNYATAELKLKSLLSRFPDSPFAAEASRALQRIRNRRSQP